MNGRETLAERLERRSIPEPNSGCFLWLGCTNPLGYGRVFFQGRNCLAHRVAWISAHGEIPLGKLVCHHCDTPLCINPNHLFLGTDADNAADKVRKGRQAHNCGESAGNAKLSEEQARIIRSGRLRWREATQLYRVSRTLFYSIRGGTAWRHLTNG